MYIIIPCMNVNKMEIKNNQMIINIITINSSKFQCLFAISVVANVES